MRHLRPHRDGVDGVGLRRRPEPARSRDCDGSRPPGGCEANGR